MRTRGDVVDLSPSAPIQSVPSIEAHAPEVPSAAYTLDVEFHYKVLSMAHYSNSEPFKCERAGPILRQWPVEKRGTRGAILRRWKRIGVYSVGEIAPTIMAGLRRGKAGHLAIQAGRQSTCSCSIPAIPSRPTTFETRARLTPQR